MPQGFPRRWYKRRTGESLDQPYEQPMPVHRRMPVVAAEESGSQFSGWGHVRIAVQAVTKFVRIFLVEARKRKIGEPLSSVNVKLGGCGSALSTHQVSSEEQENDAYGKFHRLIL